MHQSVRLGRIAGITVGLHWSVLVIAWLLAWSLAVALYPEVYPDNHPVLYWCAALVSIVLFFGSLLAHEIGHSLVARRRGVRVTKVTLWMLGGMASLEEDVTDPGDELRIAVVGPLVSAALALGFGGVALVLTWAGVPPLLAGIPAWLGWINLLLAAFNLLPAFPMDGGRVLRALVWRRSRNRLSSTRIAAGAGVALGYGLVLLGIWIALSGGGFSGIWFALIGMFLVFAARGEATSVEQQQLLGGIRVSDVMTPQPLTAPGSITVQELLDDYVLRQRVSCYPVLDHRGRAIGLVTLDHLRQVPVDRRRTTLVRDAASPLADVMVAEPDQPMSEILPRLARSPQGRLLVMRAGELIGIISHTDVVRALQVRSLIEPQPQ